jgi:hypothetical protein
MLIWQAWLLWTDGKLGDLIYSPPGNVHKEIERHIHVAASCHNAKQGCELTKAYAASLLPCKS